MKIFNFQFSIFKNKKGFTVLEMLVVISIMALLSSLLILYSRAGENQMILFRDQAKVITALNRAKSLSVQMFNAPDVSCGFGVHFSQTENSFLIFRDLPPLGGNCQNANHIYDKDAIPTELFESYQLSPRIKFEELPLTDTLTDIVFIPPDPKTLIDNDPNKGEPGKEPIIILQTLDGNASLKVKVNNAGQITTQ